MMDTPPKSQPVGWPAPRRAAVKRHGPVRLLEWSGFRARPVELEPDLLEEFLNLPGADDETFVSYARRWGVLGPCWHRSPGSSEPEHGWHELSASIVEFVTPGRRFRRPPPPPGWIERDPLVEGRRLLDQWERLAGRLAAAVRLGHDLRRGASGEPRDWDVVWDLVGAGAVMLAESAEFRAAALKGLLAGWQDGAHLIVTADPLAVPASVIAHPRGLDGALVALLFEAILADQTAARCDACGRIYLRSGRPPRVGQHNYCPKDRERGAWRVAQAARRARINEDEEKRMEQRRVDAARKRASRSKPIRKEHNDATG